MGGSNPAKRLAFSEAMLPSCHVVHASFAAKMKTFRTQCATFLARKASN